MRKVLYIDQPARFHRAAARTVLAGGALLLLRGLTQLPPLASVPYGVLVFLNLLLLALALRPPSNRQGAICLLLCALVGAALSPFSSHLSGLWLVVPLALTFAWPQAGDEELPRPLRALAVLMLGLLGLGALQVARALLRDPTVHELPGQVGPTLAGLGAGLVLGCAPLFLRLRLRTDAMDAELRGLLPAPPQSPASADPADEISRLVAEAARTYQEAAPALADNAPALRTAEELVKKIGRFGRRWREIEAEARRSDAEKLRARLADLAQRQDAARDPEVQADYGRAAAAVQAQLDALQDIDRGRERAVARLHHQVATLERLRLCALRHRSVDAGRQADELKSILEDLSRAGQELDTAAEALAEVP